MDNFIKEKLQESFEVISRTADDCTYILMDNTLSNEELENKLKVRLTRIDNELLGIVEDMREIFAKAEKEPENRISTNIWNTKVYGLKSN